MKKQNKKRIMKVGIVSSAIVIVFILTISTFLSQSSFFKYLSFVKGLQFSNIISGVLAQNTNDYRIANKENSLIVSEKLTVAAQMKADDMAKKSYFSHTGPQGEKPWIWFERGGYKYEYAGENLAIDFTESDSVSTAWIDSARHKANLLNPNFTEIGIGIAEGYYEGHKTTFVVQFFGKPEEVKIVNPKQKINTVALKTVELKAISDPKLAVVTIKGLPLGEVLGEEDSKKNKIWVWLLNFLTIF